MRQLSMRIVHVIARLNRGGTASWLKMLIKEQLNCGHEVFLLAGYVQNGEIEDEAFLELGGIRIESLGRKVNLINDLSSFIEIRKKIKELNVDLVNTHTSKAGVLGRLASFSLKKPAIVHTYHGHVLYGYFPKVLVLVIVGIEKFLGKLSDLLLVSGEQVKTDLVHAKIAPVEKLYLVRPGVFPVENTFKKEFKETIVVGWLGRLAEVKRPDRVLELAKDLPKIKFLIGGEGELRLSLMRATTRNIEFLGWVDPKDFWSKCDIALLTSNNEAQPISLVEAAFHGIPAVAENVGSVKEVVIQGETGFLTKSHSERVKAIILLAESPELRESMGSKARELANVRFGVSQFIEGHEKAYKMALNIHKIKHSNKSEN